MESANKRSGQAETASPGKSRNELLRLIRQLGDMREEMLRFADNCRGALRELDPLYEKSAENLLHYLALRRHDLRALQSELAELGLSVTCGRLRGRAFRRCERTRFQVHEAASRRAH